jgi:hypothetical protein
MHRGHVKVNHVGRQHSDRDRLLHVVYVFEPVFKRLHEPGFSDVWQDERLWKHRVLQQPTHA